MAMRLGWFQRNQLFRSRPSRPSWRKNLKIHHFFAGVFIKTGGWDTFRNWSYSKRWSLLAWKSEKRRLGSTAENKKKYIFESICYVWPLWFIIGKLKTLFSNGENVRFYEKRIPLKFVQKSQKLSFLTAWSKIELKFNSFMMENRFWPKLLMFQC